MKKIELSAGKHALVDDEDYEFLNRWKWSASYQHGIWYAQTKIMGKPIRMHRLIMNAKSGEILDHINRNGIDNRKSNLRFITTQQNLLNRRVKRNTTSIYHGVALRKSTGKWEAYTSIFGKRKHLGFFIDEEDAAREYDKHTRSNKYASLNFPDDKSSQ